MAASKHHITGDMLGSHVNGKFGACCVTSLSPGYWHSNAPQGLGSRHLRGIVDHDAFVTVCSRPSRPSGTCSRRWLLWRSCLRRPTAAAGTRQLLQSSREPFVLASAYGCTSREPFGMQVAHCSHGAAQLLLKLGTVRPTANARPSSVGFSPMQRYDDQLVARCKSRYDNAASDRSHPC